MYATFPRFCGSNGKRSETNQELPLRVLFLFTIFIVFCQGAAAQAPSPTPVGGIEEVYLARDDGKGRAGEQVTEFRTNDIPIYCVVLLESDAKTTVKINFVAVKVSGVRAETKVVTASYTTKEGQNRVNFTGRPEDVWTPGRYRVDLFLDGKLVKNVEFDIKSAGGDLTAAKFLQPAVPPKPKPVKRAGRTQP